MRSMSQFKSRTLALFLGLLFCVLVIEVGLRAIGLVEDFQRKKSTTADSSAYRIMCIGNSYTYGAGAPKGFSYPEQLEKFLNNEGKKKYQVINRGLLNVNSTFITESLPKWLEKDRPEIVFAMVGEPNMWNKYGYWKYLQETEKNRKKEILEKEKSDYGLHAFFSWSKTYRLAELLINRPESWNMTDGDYSNTFQGMGKRTNQEKYLLAYLWIGAVEIGFYKYHELTPEQTSEASEMLLYLSTVEPSNGMIWRILAELRTELWDDKLILKKPRISILISITRSGTSFNS